MLQEFPSMAFGGDHGCLLQWERLKAERDKEDLKDCTFAPAVNACAGPHTPLHRRLSELQRQRRCALTCCLTLTTSSQAAPCKAAPLCTHDFFFFFFSLCAQHTGV